MPETDNPLKVLVCDFAPDFAAWLRAAVRRRPGNQAVLR